MWINDIKRTMGFFRIEIIVIKIIEAHGQYMCIVLASGASAWLAKIQHFSTCNIDNWLYTLE